MQRNVHNSQKRNKLFLKIATLGSLVLFVGVVTWVVFADIEPESNKKDNDFYAAEDKKSTVMHDAAEDNEQSKESEASKESKDDKEGEEDEAEAEAEAKAGGFNDRDFASGVESNEREDS